MQPACRLCCALDLCCGHRPHLTGGTNVARCPQLAISQQPTCWHRLAVRQRCGHRVVQINPMHAVVGRQAQRGVHLQSGSSRRRGCFGGHDAVMPSAGPSATHMLPVAGVYSPPTGPWWLAQPGSRPWPFTQRPAHLLLQHLGPLMHIIPGVVRLCNTGAVKS